MKYILLAVISLIFTQSFGLPSYWVQKQEDIEKVFEKAKQERKLLFFYWGAKWCPPCNRLKSRTLLNNSFQKYIKENKKFIPVYVDGDMFKAQEYADELKAKGYPTLLVINHKKEELSRLNASLSAPELIKALEGISYKNTIDQLYRRALSYRGATAKQWELLAAYSWDQDHHEILGDTEINQLYSLGKLFNKSSKQSKKINYHFGILYLRHAAIHDLKISQKNKKKLQEIWKDMFSLKSSFPHIPNHLEIFAYHYYPMRQILFKGEPKQSKEINSISAPAASTWGQRILAQAQRAVYFYETYNKHSNKIIESIIEEIIDVTKHGSKGDYIDALSSAVYVHYASSNYNLALRYTNTGIKEAKYPFYFMNYQSYVYEKMGKPKLSLKWSKKAYGAAEGRSTKLEQSVRYMGKIIDVEKDFKANPEPMEYILDQTGKNPDLILGRGKTYLERLHKYVKSLSKSKQSKLRRLSESYCSENKLKCSKTLELIF